MNILKRALAAVALAVGLATGAGAQFAVVLTSGTQTINGTKTLADYLRVTGIAFFGAAAQSNFDGSGMLTAPSVTIATDVSSFTILSPSGLKASSGNFTGTGLDPYDITTASGIYVGSGRIKLSTGAYIEWPSGAVTTGPFSGGSSSGGGHVIASGTLSGSGTTVGTISGQLPQMTTLYLDVAQFDLYTDQASSSTIVRVKSGMSVLPTHTVLTSGAGTYTPPVGATLLRVRECAGGGGGGISAGIGGASSFGTIIVSSGNAGGSTGQGGAGGSGGGGGSGVFASSSVVRAPGNGGGSGIDAASIQAGSGGGSAFFGGGAPGVSSAKVDGVANSGGGGSGNPAIDGTSSGGGGGECAEIYINSPGAVPYVVGAGGTAGTSGGAGGSGIIMIDEYYGAQGFSAPASSYTFVAETTSNKANFSVAVATVSLTASGAPLRFSVAGAAFIDGAPNDVCWTVLVDGQFATGFTNNIGMVCNYFADAACHNMSGSMVLTGIAAGTHSFALAPAIGTANNVKFLGGTTLCNGVLRQKTIFGVEEVRNTAGTGDVSSNGDRTLTGTTIFNGVVAVSSQAAGNNLGDNSSFTNTTFGVCRSTLTITAGGFNPIMAYINVIGRENSSNALMEWTVYQDGVPAFGTTSAGGGTAFATATDFPVAGQFLLPVPTQGTHNYCLAMRVSAGTGTLNESKGIWGVYELH